MGCWRREVCGNVPAPIPAQHQCRLGMDTATLQSGYELAEMIEHVGGLFQDGLTINSAYVE